MGCCPAGRPGCSGKGPPQLYPCNPPVALVPCPGFLSEKQSTILVKEKPMSISGDDFDIMDAKGNYVAQCQAKALAINDTKNFFDPHGDFIFTLQTKRPTFKKTFQAIDPHGQEILNIRARAGFSTKFRVTMTNASTGEQTILAFKGRWKAKTAKIRMNGQVIADICRPWKDDPEALFDRSTYSINCAPGVDQALMAALCICFDEYNYIPPR